MATTDPRECLSRLVDLVRTGKFLSELRTDPGGVFHCVLGVLFLLSERISPHDPDVIGDDSSLLADLHTLAEALDVDVKAGPVDVLVQLLIQKLMEMLREAFEEWLNSL